MLPQKGKKDAIVSCKLSELRAAQDNLEALRILEKALQGKQFWGKMLTVLSFF